MTQCVFVQVGQCGNQIGSEFWKCALREHFSVGKSKSTNFNDSLATFFEHEDKSVTMNSMCVPNDLRARAVLIDMEEGVVNSIVKKADHRFLFDKNQMVTDVSGSGNNWAVGFYEYGNKYSDRISEAVRKAVEKCDCIQCFFITHSMGGGTGSGLGTFTLQLLEDEYPDVFRFDMAVYPDDKDDVITSPYNTLLATNKLINHADCVLPIHNTALIDIIQKHKLVPASKKDSEKNFDVMNSLVAQAILNMTCSSRFEGSLNTDLNEIITNLVPFPKIHYLLSSISPIPFSKVEPRSFDQLFNDSFAAGNHLTKVTPDSGVYLACALMARGNVTLENIYRGISRIPSRVKFVDWNKDSWKIGLCSSPPVGQKTSIFSLSNNTAITQLFDHLSVRVNKLYSSKAYLHHYTGIDGMEKSHFAEALDNLKNITASYADIAKTTLNPSTAERDLPRLKIL